MMNFVILRKYLRKYKSFKEVAPLIPFNKDVKKRKIRSALNSMFEAYHHGGSDVLEKMNENCSTVPLVSP